VRLADDAQALSRRAAGGDGISEPNPTERVDRRPDENAVARERMARERAFSSSLAGLGLQGAGRLAHLDQVPVRITARTVSPPSTSV
jgi:hypothetical protein